MEKEYCTKCQKETSHHLDSKICKECGRKKENDDVDFIKTQETELDLLK
jgi:hypothetical protein